MRFDAPTLDQHRCRLTSFAEALWYSRHLLIPYPV